MENGQEEEPCIQITDVVSLSQSTNGQHNGNDDKNGDKVDKDDGNDSEVNEEDDKESSILNNENDEKIQDDSNLNSNQQDVAISSQILTKCARMKKRKLEESEEGHSESPKADERPPKKIKVLTEDIDWITKCTYQCHSCHEQFKSNSNLKAHCNGVHEMERVSHVNQTNTF